MKPIRVIVSACIAALAVGVVASPAFAAYDGIRPSFGRSDAYFHCNGETKVYNANWLAELGADTSFVPWDADPPAESVADGAGCGGGDAGWVTNEVYDVTFQGTFTGNLRDLTVHLHEFLVGNTRDASTQPMRVYAEVDGVPVFPHGSTDGAYDGRAFTVTPVVENSGATALFEFSITGLGYADYVYDGDGELVDVQTGGVALEDGNGTAEHTFKLLVGVDAFPGDQPPTGSDLWVWDTTEVPSGITFNPTSLAGDRVAADLPEFGQG